MGSVSVTLHLGDCRDVLATLPPDSHDVCVSDPPYADETHDNAKSRGKDSLDADGKPGHLLTSQFGSIAFPDLRDTLGLVGTVTRRWIVITCDWRHAAKLSETPPAGLWFVRFGVWVKPNGAPQFTGDRPGQGWEAVAWLHRKGTKATWNGGGRSSVFIEPKVSGDHPTQKPLPMIRQFVALTSDGGPVNAIVGAIIEKLKTMDAEDLRAVTRFVCGPDIYWALKVAEGPGPRFSFPQEVAVAVEKLWGRQWWLLNAQGAKIGVGS